MRMTTEKYDQQKIDRLRHFLESMAEKGQPRPFEVFVDTLKVVPKTEDIKDFDNYEFYVNEDTRKIKIVIYNTALSPRNDQYCFTLKEEPISSEVSCLNGFESQKGLGAIIQEKLDERDREHELKRLTEKLADAEEELTEAEKITNQLLEKIDALEAERKKLDNMKLYATLAGQFLQSNKGFQSSPLGSWLNGLAGIGTAEQAALPAPSEPVGCSFEPADDAQSQSPADLEWQGFRNQMETAFPGEKVIPIMAIISVLAVHPEHVAPVSQLLNISDNQQEKQEA